jgi:triacylglycerol esterase/lipase EstA (alpha/beta hydrolase family)
MIDADNDGVSDPRTSGEPHDSSGGTQPPPWDECGANSNSAACLCNPVSPAGPECGFQGSTTEDRLEDSGYGKIVVAGQFDTDSDGIPDFADGMLWRFDENGSAPPEGPGINRFGSSMASFTRIGLSIPSDLSAQQLAHATVRFNYRASIPDAANENSDLILQGVPGQPGVFRYALRGYDGIAPTEARFRLWLKNGDRVRDVRPVWSEGTVADQRGDFIPPHVAIPLSELTPVLMNDGPGHSYVLFLEAVTPDLRDIQNARYSVVGVELVLPAEGGPPGQNTLTDEVHVTSVAIEFIDMRAFSPTLTGIENAPDGIDATRDSGYQSGPVTIAAAELDSRTVLRDYSVGGMITDGAAAVLVRIHPKLPDLGNSAEGQARITDLYLSVGGKVGLRELTSGWLPIRADRSPEDSFPGVYGGFFPFSELTENAGGFLTLPPLPMSPETASARGFRSSIALSAEDEFKAVYVPPRNFVNQIINKEPAHPPLEAQEENPRWFQDENQQIRRIHMVQGGGDLSNIETAPMRLVILRKGIRGGEPRPIMERPFNLRRPPLVLVHGILGNGHKYFPIQSWEGKRILYPTRIYRADYYPTRSKGLAENFGVVPATITIALNEYRNALDNVALEEQCVGENGRNHFNVFPLARVSGPPNPPIDSPTDNPNQPFSPEPAYAPGAGFFSTFSCSSELRAFNGIRYAAQQADVVVHSMGGLLVRTYLSDLADDSEFRLSRAMGTNSSQESPSFSGGILNYGDAYRNWPHPLDAAYQPRTASLTHYVHVYQQPAYDFFIPARSPSPFRADVMAGVNLAWLPVRNPYPRYLRSDNLGAGDIRRVVTIGTPWQGSPLAWVSEFVYRPSLPSPFQRVNPSLLDSALAELQAYEERRRQWSQEDRSTYQRLATYVTDEGLALPTARGDGSFIWSTLDQTGNVDLAPDSVALRSLQRARYPDGAQAVPWIPIVGVALNRSELNVANENGNLTGIPTINDPLAFHMGQINGVVAGRLAWDTIGLPTSMENWLGTRQTHTSILGNFSLLQGGWSWNVLPPSRPSSGSSSESYTLNMIPGDWFLNGHRDDLVVPAYSQRNAGIHKRPFTLYMPHGGGGVWPFTIELPFRRSTGMEPPRDEDWIQGVSNLQNNALGVNLYHLAHSSFRAMVANLSINETSVRSQSGGSPDTNQLATLGSEIAFRTLEDIPMSAVVLELLASLEGRDPFVAKPPTEYQQTIELPGFLSSSQSMRGD